MDKDRFSFADVEQLLTELAQHDLQTAARDEAQTELMRGAARREIRRVFFRRRCLRAAGSMAVFAGLGGAFSLLMPEDAAQAPALATSLPVNVVPAAAPAPVIKARADAAMYSPSQSALPAKASLESNTAACELVIYAVPL